MFRPKYIVTPEIQAKIEQHLLNYIYNDSYHNNNHSSGKSNILFMCTENSKPQVESKPPPEATAFQLLEAQHRLGDIIREWVTLKKADNGRKAHIKTLEAQNADLRKHNNELGARLNELYTKLDDKVHTPEYDLLSGTLSRVTDALNTARQERDEARAQVEELKEEVANERIAYNALKARMHAVNYGKPPTIAVNMTNPAGSSWSVFAQTFSLDDIIQRCQREGATHCTICITHI